MVDPALAALLRETQRKTDTPNGVAVAAARDILDRAGLAAAPPPPASTGTTIQLVVMHAGQVHQAPAAELAPGRTIGVEVVHV